MLLSPAERVLLLQFLPPGEGNAALLRGIRKLRKDLAFSDQENAKWHVVTTPPTATRPGTLNWEGNERTEIEMSPVVTGYIQACFQNAETAGKLSEGLLDVFDSFFPPEA